METYFVENLWYMRQRESKLPRYKRKSPQLQHRRILIDWICTSGESLEFHKSTIHLAVILLDRFMDGHKIESKSLHFVCLACLSLSAKFDMKETKKLRFSNLSTVLDKTYRTMPPHEFRRLEAMILDHFEWNIFIPSPTHYVDILRNNILLSDDIYGGNQLPEAKSRQFTEILDGLTDFIHYFLDISMQEDSLAGEKPSIIGAASIFCARSVLEVRPIWPSHLERLLGLSESQLSSSSKMLLATYFIAENGNNKESDDNKNSSEILEELPNTPPRKKMKTEEFVTPDEGYISRTSFEEQTPKEEI